MTIAILATGDELVHGDTLNTNSHEIAHALSSEGLPLGFHLACSDKETDIIDSLHFLAEKNDIIILIGGLGPTTDDLTRFALAQFTGETLVQHIEFKVRCTSDLVDSVSNIVEPILTPYMIATPEKKASDNLRELILRVNQPITIIDEVTGGVLQTLLMKPGTQHLINFHNLKKAKLYFHLSGLDEYWSQQPTKGTTQLTIHYNNQDQQGGETHQIPFYSSLVVYHAAEWLSFRLFHLINQLHQ